jgi:catechol 2,3-dioxygenase
MGKVTVNVDGGSRGNPGPAAVGVIVRDGDGEILEERGERIGRATNNVAEYRALLMGIEMAAAHGASELELVGDSELVVRQVEGKYKVKDATLRELHAEVKRALQSFDSWSIRHVRREHNADADSLVNAALDGEQARPVAGSDPGSIDPGVDIGHVHLKVADVDRALDFYRGVLGFELMQRYGDDAAFVSAGGYHHHIGLNSWESKGGSPPPRGTTGLYHTAIRYPTRRALADALQRLIDAGIRLTGASDHGVSEALYVADPDGNGVELYWDRPEGEWPQPQPGQKVEMYVRPLDLDDLLAELS